MTDGMPHPDKMQAILDNLTKLEGTHFNLALQLRRSMQILKLWPEAFADDCTCKPYCIGTARPHGMPHAGDRYPYPFSWVKDVRKCGLRRSDGVEKTLTMDQLCSIYDGTRP